MADFPPFAFTTQESWYGELSFKAAEDGSPVSLAGRQFEMHITPAASGAQLVPPVLILTMEEGRGLSLKQGDPSTLVFRVPRTTANMFPRSEYTGDVLEVVNGERYLFMPVRITYAEPSGLRTFLTRFLGVSVSFAARQQPIYTPLAVPGREGRPGATILRGTVPPVPADGKDGDFYIEDRTASGQGRRMYGPKAGGAWPGTPWNIQVAAISDVPGLPKAIEDRAERAANLGDLSDKTAARSNIGLGNVENTSDAAKPVSLAQGMAIAARLAAASNLADLADKVAARSNIGLGASATRNVDVAGGVASFEQVAARAYQPAYKTLVIFGSSNGAGMGASSYTGDPTEANGWASPATSWAGLLAASLKQHDPVWQVYNRSISGSGVVQSLQRFYTDVAPHRPSHVLIATHPKNDGYDVQRTLRGTELLCRMCDAIGAVPIIRGAYPDNAMSAAEYRLCLDLNAALDTLGRNRVDHMSIMDDGAGHIVGGSAYHIGDGLHLNDAGQELQFRAIDIGLFTYGASMRFADADRGFAWQITPSTTTGTAIVLNAASGLLNPPRSFTMRARVKSGPGSTGALVPLAAYAQGLGTEADQNNIVRIRAANGPYALADVGGVVGANSTVNPRSDGTTVRDLALVVNAATNQMYFYIDGVLISAGAPNAPLVPPKVFSIGGRAESANIFPASGLAIAGVGIWNVPLSLPVMGEMYRTGRLPPAGLIFSAVFSGTPGPSGIVPNTVRNSLVGRLGEAPWQAVPNI